MSELPSHCTCYYCKLSHRLVEAGGLYHCPNPLCMGPGACTFRLELASYREVGDARDSHTVDHEEMIAFGLAHAARMTDAPLAAHIRASVPRWMD